LTRRDQNARHHGVLEVMAMTPGQWAERYRRAWETADTDEIVDLFTPDASYRSSVFRAPYLGSDAIRQYWQRGAGTQRQVAVRMGRPIITDDRVAVEWWTTMIDPDHGEITLPGWFPRCRPRPIRAPGHAPRREIPGHSVRQQCTPEP
jgi:SnoaL-like domain